MAGPAAAAAKSGGKAGGGGGSLTTSVKDAMEISEKLATWIREDKHPDVIAVVENRTETTWELVPGTSAPIHGDWMETPTSTIGPLSALDPNQTTTTKGSPIGGMGLDGRGKGSVSLAVYWDKTNGSTGNQPGDADTVLALYLRKTPARAFKAGAWLTTFKDLKAVGEWGGEGDDVSEHIRDASATETEIHLEGDGMAAYVTNGVYSTLFQPNNETPYTVTFTIKN